MNNCLVTTEEIRDLTKKLQGETEESVKGLVALQQKDNNKSIEEYPTAKELNNFKVKLRGSTYKVPVSSYTGDITPDANTIFVFGSNPEGRHGAGAAKIAREQFGAIYGQGEGLQGNAYALPTKDLRVTENNGLRSISEAQIIENIKKLYETARQNPDKQFKIAYRNTDKASLNGYTGLEMIDMFLKAGSIPSNIVFSKEWVDTGKFNLLKEELEGSEAVQMLDEVLSSSFDTHKISSIEEQAKVDLDFDPRTRRDRVTLIARFFSNEVDKALQEINDSINKRMDTASDEERLQLQNELSSLDRFTAIKKCTPAGLFSRVLDIFQSYINDTEENRVKVELDKINSAKGADKYSDEQKLTAAKKKA